MAFHHCQGCFEVECRVVEPCIADLDGDGTVGFTDLTGLLASWGPCPGCPADFKGDGTVGFTDRTTILAAWGPCP